LAEWDSCCNTMSFTSTTWSIVCKGFMLRPNTSSVLWAFCQCWWFKEWSSKEFSLLSSIVAAGTHKMQKDLDMQRLHACTPLFICSFFILARSVLGMLECSKPCGWAQWVHALIMILVLGCDENCNADDNVFLLLWWRNNNLRVIACF
jgi:hypothetical protein